MAFNKKTWKDRVSEQPQRRILTNVDNNEEMTVDVTRFEGIVVQEGDAFSANNMNDLENRIKATFDSDEATMNAINNKANTNATNISSLQSSVNSVSGRVTTNTNNISSLSTRMTNVEGKANTNANNISSLSGRVTNVESKANANANNISSLNNSKAPTNHAVNADTYGLGTPAQYGHVKVSDATNASNNKAEYGMAASGKAVADAYTSLRTFDTEIDQRLSGRLFAPRANAPFYFDWQNGKYGFNTDATRGADTFHPFKQAYELLGTTDFDVSEGTSTQVAISLSKVPDDYIVCFSHIGATSTSYNNETRTVDISSYSISGSTCTVTLTHQARTDHHVGVFGTLAVYGA